jgi:hypothetical protein
MIVAKKKRKENIAEYLLYMWQVEDLIRANGLDADAVRRTVVSRYDRPEEEMTEIERWYAELTDMMRKEGLAERGHLLINRNVMSELTDLHHRLMADPEEQIYGAAFYKTLPYIVQLRAKSGGKEAGEIETCFNAIYGYLTLRMQQKEITPQTEEAMKQIAAFLALLSEKFRKEEDNEL